MTPFCTHPALMPMEGLFETILTKEDAVISDALNHASIIDGIRLSKAMRYRYLPTTWTTCGSRA